MDINKWVEEIHNNAVEHGWWDEPRSFGEIVALCHSELSEALEEDRAGNKIRAGQPTPLVYYSGGGYVATLPTKCCKKPEGIAVEMIDCMIRILDWCGSAGVDVEAVLALKHEYNKSRPYKHGKKY